MKTYKLYTGTKEVSFQLEEEQLLYYASPTTFEGTKDEQELIEGALDNPIGARRLEEAVPENGKVIIIVDDATRPTPCRRIIPHLLPRILKKSSDITFMTAPGTHRPMTEEELDEKIGKDILANYKLINVDYTNEEEYEYVMTTELGTPVDIHKAVLAADFVLTIGNIVPHVVVGWSGGAKTIQPGVSARRTTDFTHWLGAVQSDTMDIVGTLDNICRKEIDYIGSQVNISYIVNTVLNDKKEIVGLFCGHYIEAHREGVRLAQKVLCPEIPGLADIVIANAAPCNFDFWQGFKPFAFAQFGVKEGGTIIFLLEATEGLCGNAPFHLPALEKYMPMPLDGILREAKEGLIEDQVGSTNAINHHKIIGHAEVICVSEGLREIDYELLQFQRADSVQQALDMALKRQGEKALVGIIPFCGETLVKVKHEPMRRRSMKAVVLKSDNKIHYMDAPKPTLAHGEVLVKVRACGICGSDIRYLEGENPWSQQTLGYVSSNPDNMILGHEFAGDVVEVKDEKDQYLIGKKVGVIVYNTCRSCEFCRTGRMNLCKNTKHIGHGAGWEDKEFYPGGMAEYCQVWSDHVYPFEHASYEEASTLDFVAVGLAAVEKVKKVFAEDALIIGTGPVGLAMIQLLKLKGARKVYCVDILDYAFEIAKQTGADETFNSTETDVVAKIKELTNQYGVSMVFDTVGEPDTQRMAFDCSKGQGTIVNLVCNTNEVSYQLRDFSSERSIVSVANASDNLYFDCMKMLEAGRINMKPLITDVIPLSEAKEGFDRLLHREDTKAVKVVLKP